MSKYISIGVMILILMAIQMITHLALGFNRLSNLIDKLEYITLGTSN